MRGLCHVALAALALLKPIHATPINDAPDPNKPDQLGYTPMDRPDPVTGPPEYPPTVVRKFKRYVALGDSYSAGPGATTDKIPDRPGPNPPYTTDCFQTNGGWPKQLKDALDSKMDFQFSACTGYTTQDIRKVEVVDEKSNFNGPDNKWPDLVSVTMGGNNDNAFLNVIMACSIRASFSTCDEALTKAQKTIDGIEKEFSDTMDAIMTQGRDGWRTLLVMGYPELYSDQPDDPWNCIINATERKRVNTLVQNVNGVLKKVAGATHDTWSKKPPATGGGDVVFADPNDAWKSAKGVEVPDTRKFDGNRFCEAKNRAYFNGGDAQPLTLDNWDTWFTDWKKGLFHPDANGMRVMADAAQVALSGLSEKVPTGDGGGGGGGGGGDGGNSSSDSSKPTTVACSPVLLADAGPKIDGTEYEEEDLDDDDGSIPPDAQPLDSRSIQRLQTRAEKPLVFIVGPQKTRKEYSAPDYPHYDDVAIAKGAWATKYPGQCGGLAEAILYIPAGTGWHSQTGIEWVTEHVFEAQALKNYIQSMTLGKLRSGGPLRQGPAEVRMQFDDDGKFFSSWAGQGRPDGPLFQFGDTPADTAFGHLGHKKVGNVDADMSNLEVLDQTVNSLKGFISKGFQFVADKKWDTLDPGQKMWMLHNSARVFEYMRQDQVVQSYNTAFLSLVHFWQQWQQVPGVPHDYDFAAAFGAIVQDDLNLQVTKNKALWIRLCQDRLRGEADPNVRGTLQQWLNDADQHISYRVADMVKVPWA